MKHLYLIMSTLVLFFLHSCHTKNTSIMLASGAGYKNPVTDIQQLYFEKTGNNVEMLFGNMQTISQQTLESGQISIVIGDLDFLQNSKYGVNYSEFEAIGTGKLVLAFAQNNDFHQPEDLMNSKIQRLLIPDPVNAIYGRAAKEYLVNKNLWSALQNKILEVKTVPMVSSYLITNEADAGFINLTEAISLKEKIDNTMILNDHYSQIQIVAGVVKGFEKNKQVEAFLTFLSENTQVKKIFASYGL